MSGVVVPGHSQPAGCWTGLHLPDCPLVIEQRELGELAWIAARLAVRGPFERKAAARPEEAVAELGLLPRALRDDILLQAQRFAAFMQVDAVRLRLEAVTTNACRKIHADYTDLRLITTYHGPGTDYLPVDAEPVEGNLLRMITGHIGLFKGRLFADGHVPCLHRSPPIEATGEKRLVLVIDTPLEEAKAIELQLNQSGH
jgi:hypothetical protein